MAHLQPDVPQGVEDLLDEFFRLLRHPLLEEKQNVHVGMEALFFPPVASEGDQYARVLLHVHSGTHRTPGEAFLEIVIQDLRVLIHEVGRTPLHESCNQCFPFFL